MIPAELGRKSVQYYQGTGSEVTAAEPYLVDINQSLFPKSNSEMHVQIPS